MIACRNRRHEADQASTRRLYLAELSAFRLRWFYSGWEPQ